MMICKLELQTVHNEKPDKRSVPIAVAALLLAVAHLLLRGLPGGQPSGHSIGQFRLGIFPKRSRDKERHFANPGRKKACEP